MNRMLIMVMVIAVNSTAVYAQVVPVSASDQVSEQKVFYKRWWLEQVKSPRSKYETISIGYSAIDAMTAEIYLFDKRGKKISTYTKLSQRGTIQIKMDSLSAGQYTYVLVINSRMIAKRKFSVPNDVMNVSSTDSVYSSH